MRQRTKIIATVGPSCLNDIMIQKLINVGVNCFRVNLSHGTSKEKKKIFQLIKTTITSSGFRPTILADLAGPKIRVSGLRKDMVLNEGEEIVISNEQLGKNVIPVSKNVKFQRVEDGAKILIDPKVFSSFA